MQRSISRFSGRLLCAALLCWAPTAYAQDAEVVLEDDFEASLAVLTGTSQVLDPGDGRDSLLSLTQGANNQAGFAWFPDAPFDLRESRVEVEFDFWLRTGTSAVPADGMSIIFQFGDDPNAQGGLGGNLGTCNFPTDYVSVAFDIWDNRETNDLIDPNNTPCFDAASTRSCHIEVNQNSCPINVASAQTNVDFGVVDIPNFIAVGDLLVPIACRIIFDNGRIEVFLQTEEHPDFLDFTKVLDVQLEAFPEDASAIVGFAASTGAANAHHEIDNLVILEGDATPQENVALRLGDGTRGAINCGGDVEVTGDVNGEEYTFVADTLFGTFIGSDREVVPNQNFFARYGHTAGGNLGAVTNPIAGAGALEAMYQSERWNNSGVAYDFECDPGRYEVNLHLAEICTGCGPEGTRVIHSQIEGERALTFYSASGEVGYLTAVTKTYEVDVTDGVLTVIMSDTGILGSPPDNARVNGISYRRIGNATGAEISGDLEDNAPPALPSLGESVLIETDFDEDVGFAPENMIAIGTDTLTSGIVVDFSDHHQLGIDPRLRLSTNTANLANAILIDEPVNLRAVGFVAEFTAHMTWDVLGTNPADGLTFFFVPGEDIPLSPGGLGLDIGYGGIATEGFAVEIDTWQGTNDPSGFNTNGYGHVALVANGDITRHVQTHLSMDPTLVAGTSDWPFVLVDDSASLDFRQHAANTFDLESEEKSGVRVEIQLSNGRLTTSIATVNEDPELGVVFPKTVVLDTLMEFGVSGLGEGYFGFSSGTGSAHTWHEIDDLKITTFVERPVTVSRTVAPASFSDSTTPVSVSLELQLERGAGAQDVELTETLPTGFSAENISDGGRFAGGVVSWSLAGLTATTTVDYDLIPDDATQVDVVLDGAFEIGGSGVQISVNPTTLRYRPAPFGRGDADEILATDFDDDSGCPDGWSCNTSQPLLYQPGVTNAGDGHDGRLQLTNETANLGTSAFLNEPIDLSRNSLRAEFDVYFSNGTGTTPADGMVLAFLDADQSGPTSLGAAGGALGYQGGTGLTGFGIEFDLWDNDGATVPADPNGYNTVGYGHVGLIRDGLILPHVQTSSDVNPNFVPIDQGGEGWPYFVDTLGAGYPIHVEVEYSNGNVEVWISVEADNAGEEFPRTKVLDSFVTFPSVDGGPPVLQSTYVGFTAGTGSAFSYHEVDDLTITLFEARDGGGGDTFVRGDVDASGTINLTDGLSSLLFQFQGGEPPACMDAADSDDSGSLNLTDAIAIFQWLFLGGNAPQPPSPSTASYVGADCGPDPTTGDAFGCADPGPVCSQ